MGQRFDYYYIILTILLGVTVVFSRLGFPSWDPKLQVSILFSVAALAIKSIASHHEKTIIDIQSARHEPAINIISELELLSQFLAHEQTITANQLAQHQPVTGIIGGSSPIPEYEKTISIIGDYENTPGEPVVDIISAPGSTDVTSEPRLFRPTPPPIVQLPEDINYNLPKPSSAQDLPPSVPDFIFHSPSQPPTTREIIPVNPPQPPRIPTPDTIPEEIESTEQLISRGPRHSSWVPESEPAHTDDVDLDSPGIFVDPHSDQLSIRCRCCGRTFIAFNEGSIPEVAFELIWRGDLPEDLYAINFGYLKRAFQPCDKTKWRGACDSETLVKYNPRAQISNYLFSRKSYGVLYPRLTTMVVVVNGACPGNGTSRARAAVGAYFGPGSRYNCYSQLPTSSFRQTSIVAEACSALLALKKIETEVLAIATNSKIKQVVIVSDSDYVVRSMTERVWRWVENGFQTTKDKDVKNAGLLLELHRTIERLNEAWGVDVRFWRLDRQFVQEARDLANEALTRGYQHGTQLNFDICEFCPFRIPVPKTCPHVRY